MTATIVSPSPTSAETASSGGRDRTVDAVRAFAICGVVGGHWLVTGLVSGPDGWHTASPLAAMPSLAPATWLFQTLGLFFFAGGFAAARARGGGGRRTRDKLLASLLPLLAGWALALGAGAALGAPAGTLETTAKLVVSPLWFLLPYLALRIAARPLCHAVRRYGPAVAILPAAIVAGADVGWLPGWLAVPAAWTVPWLLGTAVALGRWGGRRVPVLLLIGGAAVLALLMTVGDYPLSAVGVPGEGRSNLSPPSLVAVALAVTQIGGFLLLRGAIGRLLRRPAAARAVTGLNRVAVPVYLWHQSLLLTAAALVGTRIPGLVGQPDGTAWVAARLAWLPVLALGLAVLIRGRRHARGRVS
ncbi:acyltransferase family protein [Actinoplanes sp. NPDC049548]|uniref:acyltransferase family protein n=1 Tax=Actinoplanes sp. NPDC049548 TaxID=3155152 RepID=UPI00343010BC